VVLRLEQPRHRNGTAHCPVISSPATHGAEHARCHRRRATGSHLHHQIRGRLSQRRKNSLEAVKDYLTGHKGRSAIGLALFTLSPLPSAQLFEAAGLMAAPLLPVTIAFFAGRLISYSLYIGAASAAERTLGSAFASSLTSPYGIAIQLLLLLAVVFLARIDWAKILQHRTNHHSPPPAIGNQGGDSQGT
jgi:hypothetical protein